METKLEQILRAQVADALHKPEWPSQYVNRDTNRVFVPHNQEIHDFVYTDTPRNVCIKGGEGSGKSVAGIIKTLERLRRGMDGVMVSPNLPHFNRSLWPEFRRWCPWELVVPTQRNRGEDYWEASKPFTLVIKNMYGKYSRLICGGIENPISYEGPNVHFCYVDEMRQMDDAEVIKVLTGRNRLYGPEGEPPQFYVTSTPRMHFMFDYFGPIVDDDDEYIEFKRESQVITLTSSMNVAAGNLDRDYIRQRGSTLTEQEKAVRLMGEWVDEKDDTKFLDTITFWDRLKDKGYTEVRKRGQGDWRDAIILGVDGAVTRDTFAIVGVTRHPDNRENGILVRSCKVWTPPRGGKIDFIGTPEYPGPETYIRMLVKEYNVLAVVYDEFQLHDMMTRLMREGLVWTEDLSQVKPRLMADQQLYDLILEARIEHPGIPVLREHLYNAGVKIDPESRKRRMIKLRDSKKIDAAVALSMATFKCLYLNI